MNAYEETDEIMRVFRTAVRKAQEESRRMGVANVYVINGQRYYELPNGEYTRNSPYTQNQVDSLNGN